MNDNRKKKAYVRPEITSCEVGQDAYAMGSSPEPRAKWLECNVFFTCCDTNVLPLWWCE
jgi:hypothetical protein